MERGERGPGDGAVHGRGGDGRHRLSRHGRNTQTISIPLLLANEMMGERTTIFDLKLAKNIRFPNKRATVGVDIYNVFNSDAINSYNGTISGSFVNGVWTPAVDNPATAANEGNQWLNPTGLVSPRFARLSVQFNF